MPIPPQWLIVPFPAHSFNSTAPAVENDFEHNTRVSWNGQAPKLLWIKNIENVFRNTHKQTERLQTLIYKIICPRLASYKELAAFTCGSTTLRKRRDGMRTEYFSNVQNKLTRHRLLNVPTQSRIFIQSGTKPPQKTHIQWRTSQSPPPPLPHSMLLMAGFLGRSCQMEQLFKQNCIYACC